jgi:hypothetical protein
LEIALREKRKGESSCEDPPFLSDFVEDPESGPNRIFCRVELYSGGLWA